MCQHCHSIPPDLALQNCDIIVFYLISIFPVYLRCNLNLFQTFLLWGRGLERFFSRCLDCHVKISFETGCLKKAKKLYWVPWASVNKPREKLLMQPDPNSHLFLLNRYKILLARCLFRLVCLFFLVFFFLFFFYWLVREDKGLKAQTPSLKQGREAVVWLAVVFALQYHWVQQKLRSGQHHKQLMFCSHQKTNIWKHEVKVFHHFIRNRSSEYG